MKPNITLFLPSFRGGGAERVMVNLANKLSEKGYSIDVVVANAEGPYRNELVGDVSVIDLQCARVIGAVLPLTRYLKRTKPSAVLSTLTHANVVCALAHKLARSRSQLVLREANMPDLSTDTHTRIILGCAKWLYRRADVLVCVSEGVRDALRAKLAIPDTLPMPVIDNPTVTEKLLELANQPLDPDARFPAGHVLVLACGRLTYSKGFLFLIDAFAKFQHKQPATLVILGEGEQRNELLTRARTLECEEHVLLPGFVDNPFAWMSACDVFVLSSYSEGSPNTLIQAIACGAQVISTRLAGSTDKLLNDGELGRLIDADDIIGLTEALADCIDHPIKPDVQRWRARFSDALVVSKYEQVLLDKKNPVIV